MRKPSERMKEILGEDCPSSYSVTAIDNISIEEIEDELIKAIEKMNNGECKEVIFECFICSGFLFENENHICK